MTELEIVVMDWLGETSYSIVSLRVDGIAVLKTHIRTPFCLRCLTVTKNYTSHFIHQMQRGN